MIDIVVKIMRRIKKHLTLYYWKTIRLFKPISYPQNPGNKIYIHLCCGEINSPEFINVDGRKYPHIHHQGDVKALPYFSNEFADLVYACHVLEHVYMDELHDVLKEWKRVLKKGGVLRIAVPDFDKILSIYKDNDNEIDPIWKPLLGGQEYYLNSHYAVFNKKYLTRIMLENGFTEVREWDPEKVENHNFYDWSSGKVEYHGKKYPISLNLEAVK